MTFNVESRKICYFLLLHFIISILFFCPVVAETPIESMLEIGSVVNARMKSLAAGTDQEYRTETSEIKAIHMAESLPGSFVPSDANTVSTPDSKIPVYIFFDNTDDLGIMYFYTENDTIIMNPDSRYLFANNLALADISGVAGWDSSNVIVLNSAFMGCSSLSELAPLSNWDTSSLSFMVMTFANDTALTDISALSNWDTSQVTDMFALFGGVENIKEALALRNWDTSSVTDMSCMFSGCTSMVFIDVSNWDTSKVTSMSSMFQVGKSYTGNGQLREIIGLGDLDVSNVTDMTCMFYGAGQMTTYDISRWDVSKVESMNHMFCDNYKLRSLDLSNWDVSSVKTMYCMFDDNQELLTIGDVSHWNTASLIDAGGWLNDARSFVGDNQGMLDLSGWDTRNLKSAGEMFLNTKIHTIDLSGWTFDSITNDTWEGAGRGIFYEAGNNSETLRGMGQMFKNTSQLTAVYVSQMGLESFNAAVENEINTLDMWTGSKIDGFTVK